ncbi:hypothetical protein BAUCODRAFT_473329 [Baudoinia panamericana UAMH 10762]|uniref:Uncharacterized protein n=1 Tax=Baudoinia panamericana (strain UAMH 10762) TaxID=717646 RepID=M2NBY5_BAUPA|nr:uncharacterized protein BAUCODRAFT_473329 [Baudoinia panamericana UAMH 10762]EMC96400.1 hypothetical protein BAUCODRAFT_473329 [Baudoinia panamericana UAMH 10762]
MISILKLSSQKVTARHLPSALEVCRRRLQKCMQGVQGRSREAQRARLSPPRS